MLCIKQRGYLLQARIPLKGGMQSSDPSAQVLQLLGDNFKGLASRDIAADNLYEACVVFAQVADTSDE